MVKIKRSSNELNRFLSRVYVSPKHPASFSGLDKLYIMVHQNVGQLNPPTCLYFHKHIFYNWTRLVQLLKHCLSTQRRPHAVPRTVFSFTNDVITPSFASIGY